VEAAERLTLPYVCSFEKSEDRTIWKFNDQTPNAVDQWCIGDATSSEGDSSLYISYNGGLNTRYANFPNTVAAYMTFKYPESTKQETYDFAFDWRNFGDQQKAQLRVWYGRKDQLANMLKVSETSGETFTNAELNNFTTVYDGTSNTKVLYNSESWKTATFKKSISSANANKEWVLLFMWINQTNDSASAYRLAACIDNIQIVNAQVPKPENVSAESDCTDSSLVISWESGLKEFTIAYKSSKDEVWHRQEGITEQTATTTGGWQWSYKLHNMEEGVYDIKLWGVDSIEDVNPVRVDTSMCVMLRNQVYYCADNHCVDYMHLDAPHVTCTYGTYDNPKANIGILDFGSQQKASRHTIMSDPTLTDERTNHRLYTVPEGALASVRLGNWDNGAEAESITYEMTVDESQGVLLLNYAIVLEDPEHAIVHQPYFSLRILDGGGNLIDASCAMAEYYAGYGAGEWLEETYIEQTPMSVEHHKILWKNWSTVGLNLSSHNGERIYIELTTKDCSEGMHFGYAYFTLDCTSGKIQTNNCTGASYSEATAPDGFDYEWIRDDDQSIVGYERTIQVDASDPSLYTCKCMFKENHDCYFKLQTYFKPEYPKAAFTPHMHFQDCKSELKLENTSYIWYEENGEKIISPDKPKDYLWNIRTSSGQTIQASVPNQTILCDPNGDTVFVSLTAYLSSKNCHDDTAAVIVMPRITTPDSIFQPRLCIGDTLVWEGKRYYRDTTITKKYTNQYGCDSVIRLDFKADKRRIIEQKWNDVLALLNSKYNGGYELSDFHWYRNGTLLEGQTSSYIYLPEGLTKGDEYYAEATTQTGEKLTTCSYIVEDREKRASQSANKRIINGSLQIQVNNTIYNAQGFSITVAQ